MLVKPGPELLSSGTGSTQLKVKGQTGSDTGENKLKKRQTQACTRQTGKQTGKQSGKQTGKQQGKQPNTENSASHLPSSAACRLSDPHKSSLGISDMCTACWVMKS